MSDPSIIPEGTGEVMKFASAGGGGGLLTLILGRIFRGQDKASEQILAEMKVLSASVAALTTQVALLGRTVTDVARLELTVHEQGLALAGLRATVEEMKEGMLR